MKKDKHYVVRNEYAFASFSAWDVLKNGSWVATFETRKDARLWRDWLNGKAMIFTSFTANLPYKYGKYERK